MKVALTPFTESMQAAAAVLRLPGSGLAWLDHARAAALQAFVQRGLPDTRNELWKYTALRALAQRRFQAGDDEAATRPVPSVLLPEVIEDAVRVVFVNGAFRADLSRLDNLPNGITLQPLSLALREQPEPLRFLLGAHGDEDDGFTLLNRALASDGVILRVEAGIKAAAPLHIVHIGLAGEREMAWHLRSLVEVGEGASLDIVEHHVGDPEAGHLANLVRDVNLRDKARLGWTAIQTAGAATVLLRRSDCRLGEDAVLDFHALELGVKLARHELRVELAGARSRFQSRGAFVLHDRQHADTEVLVTHRGRDTVSDSLWRGVADGHARGVAHGRILVLPGADSADGGFYNKNLLLSPDAEIDTRPALEIYADEVKANHGATVGQLDENVLFYLRSRGIPLEVARRMLVRAFCAVTLDGIEPAPLREHCEALLSAQLPEASA
ncbi:MAG: Iron-sulfur cluster assembly protein SufD [Rhodanobacteraceae bacterium]|nr:MAG: Iron-sulfur cluster assembly protein SufD [Rhodanobacteraceae bacterium]